MSRLVSNVFCLLLGSSLVLIAPGCSCVGGEMVDSELESAPTSARAPSGADGGCCHGPSERDDDSHDDCCDGTDCQSTVRSHRMAPTAHLHSVDLTGDLPAAPSSHLSALPSAARLDVPLPLDATIRDEQALSSLDGRPNEPPRYLSLRVLRL